MMKFELNESNYLILKVKWKVRDDFQHLVSWVEKYYKKHFWNDYLTMLNKNISSINTIPALKDYMKYIMNQHIIELWKDIFEDEDEEENNNDNEI